MDSLKNTALKVDNTVNWFQMVNRIVCVYVCKRRRVCDLR